MENQKSKLQIYHLKCKIFKKENWENDKSRELTI